MDYDRMEKEQSEEQDRTKKSEGGKDIQIQMWEGVIIRCHKNA